MVLHGCGGRFVFEERVAGTEEGQWVRLNVFERSEKMWCRLLKKRELFHSGELEFFGLP